MAPNLQARVLRVIEDGQIRPVGADGSRKVGVRLLAAPHQDLERRVEQGLFRPDLFYRLNVIPLRVPNLDGRREDIPILTVRRLLEDTLEEVAVQFAHGRFPDVVIAVVGRTPIESTFERARAFGANPPIVAILAYADDLVARRALELGATVTVALADGLAQLRSAVERAVAPATPLLASLN